MPAKQDWLLAERLVQRLRFYKALFSPAQRIPLQIVAQKWGKAQPMFQKPVQCSRDQECPWLIACQVISMYKQLTELEDPGVWLLKHFEHWQTNRQQSLAVYTLSDSHIPAVYS